MTEKELQKITDIAVRIARNAWANEIKEFDVVKDHPATTSKIPIAEIASALLNHLLKDEETCKKLLTS